MSSIKVAVEKPRLTFWQIWNMSFGFLGIQFGFALQNANVSRIFETLGAKVEDIPILWIFAPLAGLLVQPLIGYMSDNTWGRLGRRKPYFLLGAILSSFALFIMPNSSILWMAAGCLLILDASINVSMEPFRALVGDMLPSSQRTIGFAMQSFFIGVGAVVASALPYILHNWLGMSNTAAAGEIPETVKYSFYLGAIVFLAAVLWTVGHTKEYPPEEFESHFTEEERALEESGSTNFMTDVLAMPKTMKQLAVVQFFTWIGLFAMWIYTTSAVTSTIYGTADTTTKAYNEGADWVGVCFAAYNGFAAVMAFLLPVLAKSMSRKQVHAISLVAGGLGLISVFFIKDPKFLLVSMLGVGLAWSSILSMPYAILAGSLPKRKMGFYMGVFNFFIVIPQIISAVVLGYVTKHFFGGHAIYTLVLGGALMLLAALMVLWVDDVDESR